LNGLDVGRIPDIEIDQITPDSRKVKSGTIFVAYSGVEVDGHDFIDQAIEKGAVAVVGEKPIGDLAVPYFQVRNGRLAWAKMVANFYDNPEKKLTIIGVTGTDGKTTTTNLIYQMLIAAGIKAAMVSTIKAVIGDKEYDTGLHTSSPDPDVLWQWLVQIVATGQTHVVLETTSHGLAQYRFGDIKFDVGVLTNLAHDHLEFHKTFENYRDAKALLFEKSKVSVINECSAEVEYFKSKAAAKAISYDVRKEIRGVVHQDGDEIWQEFEMQVGEEWRKVKTRLLGDYNLENVLAAARTVTELGVSEKYILAAIAEFEPLAGRFQVIVNDRGFRAIVDFAHTEQGIRSVLGMVREHLRKDDERIVAVFGCNGGRDQSKRAPMGKAACELADMVVVTTEDPRKEPVEQIYKQLEEGCLAAGGVLNKTFFREDNRRKAIDFAINKLAKKGDWLLFLGKGHEKSMNVGGVETPWDEASIVRGSL